MVYATNRPDVMLIMYGFVVFFCYLSHDMTNQQNECAPSEDSDQPGHPPNLIRGFALRSVGSWGPKVSFMRTAKTLIRLGGCPGWSESSLDAQPLCWFCHVAAHRLNESFYPLFSFISEVFNIVIISLREERVSLFDIMSQLMRLWHLSSSVFFKRACAATQWR